MDTSPKDLEPTVSLIHRDHHNHQSDNEMGKNMDSTEDQSWNITKDKLIKEINATNEAILKFRNLEVKSTEALNTLSMDELHKELQTQATLLDKLVSDWDI